MPTLNIADLSLAIIWLFFCLRGYMRGLVREVGSLAAIILAFYCAGSYHTRLAPHLTGYISGNYTGTAAYLILFTVTLLAVWFLALGVSGIVKVTTTQWADRFFGGAFGLAKGMLLTALLLFLVHLAAPHPDFLKGSVLVPVLRHVSTKFAQFIPPDIHEKLRRFGHGDITAAKPAAPKKTEPVKKAAEPAKAPAKAASDPKHAAKHETKDTKTPAKPHEATPAKAPANKTETESAASKNNTAKQPPAAPPADKKPVG